MRSLLVKFLIVAIAGLAIVSQAQTVSYYGDGPETEKQNDVKISFWIIESWSRDFGPQPGAMITHGSPSFGIYYYNKLAEIEQTGITSWRGFFQAFELLNLDLEIYQIPLYARNMDVYPNQPSQQEIYNRLMKVMTEAKLPPSNKAIYDTAFRLHMEASDMSKIRAGTFKRSTFFRKLQVMNGILKRTRVYDLQLADAQIELKNALEALRLADKNGVNGTQDEQYVLRGMIHEIDNHAKSTVRSCDGILSSI